MRRSVTKAVVGSIVFGTLVVCACYLAYAYSSGITGQTRKNSLTAGCGTEVGTGSSCHAANANPNIQVRLSGPSVLPVGAAGTYTISVSGANTSGGGCDIAASGGTLSSSSLLLQSLNQELTHVSAIATPFSIEFTYTSNSPGLATLYANGKATSGWNWAPNLSIRIGPPPAPVPMLPADGSAGVPTSIVLSWSGVIGPKWKVQVSPTQIFTPILIGRDSLSDTTFAIPEGMLANNTQYYWRVSGSDSGGTSSWSQTWSFTTALTGIKDAPGQLPTVFALEQNWPNPFNPTTVIKYTIAGAGGWELGAGNVELKVYDMLGREVARLVNEQQTPGTYEVRFDGSGLASGIYVCRLTAGSFTQARKMILMR
jgi:hypothetical protein